MEMILVNVWTLGTKFMQNIKLSSPYYLFIILTKVKVASYILQPTLLVGDSERRSFFNFFQLLRNRTLLPKRYVCITIHFRVNRPYVDCGTTYFLGRHSLMAGLRIPIQFFGESINPCF